MSDDLPPVREFEIETLFVGDQGGPKDLTALPIGNEADWQSFFPDAAPGPCPDLGGGMVFAIGTGLRRSGYPINVVFVTQNLDGPNVGAVSICFDEERSSEPVSDMTAAPYVVFRAKELAWTTNYWFVYMASSDPPAGTDQQDPGYVVIQQTDGTGQCLVVPASAIYAAIYTQVYGPSSLDDCKAWIAQRGRSAAAV